MSSSSEDEENGHSEPLMVDINRNCHDQSSDEMKLQSGPSELETEADNWSARPEDVNHDHMDC